MKRLRIFLGCLLLSGAMTMPAAADNAAGVTDREIKIAGRLALVL